MIIDAHCHTGNCEPLFRGDNPAEDLIAAWDAAGVGAGVLSVITKGRMAHGNDSAAEAAVKYPGRIYPCAYLDPADMGAALTELARCAASGLYRGVKMHPSDDAWFPYLERYYPLYEAIAEAGLPIVMHSGTYPHSGPLAIASAARDFPQVPFILGHAGLADFSWECIPAARMGPNVYLDTALNATLPPLAEWAQRFGADRLLWGSDWPFGGVGAELAKVAEFHARGLTAGDCDLIAGGNAARIFGIPGRES